MGGTLLAGAVYCSATTDTAARPRARFCRMALALARMLALVSVAVVDEKVLATSNKPGRNLLIGIMISEDTMPANTTCRQVEEGSNWEDR